jgi:D-inositol-3-phosphate glycosyltransferase
MPEQPLRIAMLSVHTCPLATLGGKKTGGMNVYVRELSTELSRRGVFVDVYTRSQDPCVPHINESVLGERARVIHIPAGPEAPAPTHQIAAYIPEFVKNVLAFTASEGIEYDLLHSHYWLSGWAARDLARVWRVSTLQMFHTLGLMKNRIARTDDEREPPLRINTEREIMRQADYLIAATPAERIQLMWLYGADMKKIRVVPPGVDVRHFRPMPRYDARQLIGIPEEDRMLLFVGRIEPLKGIDTLLRALALVRRQFGASGRRMCLSLIGGQTADDAHEDAEMRRLKALEQELGIGDLVTFLGARSQDTLQYYYNAAEAVIMPSHYESFGMVALEAMACGTPVIASEVGGLVYLVEDGVTGFHVPTNDPSELAGRIQLLLDNPLLQSELAQAAVKAAQRYSWDRIAARIIELYQECLGQRPPARPEHWDHPH